MHRFLALAGLACGLAVFGVTDDAEACGGCFVPPPVEGGTESTVVTGHRMALSISQQRTVLWDQIQYTGSPEDFSWVLPVKPGAVLEIANDAWFDVLEAATSASVSGKTVQCPGNFGGGSFGGPGQPDDGGGFGCGSDSVPLAASGNDSFGSSGSGGIEEPPKDPVEVISEGSAGPYDMVTLSTDVPGALNEWLDDNGYEVPEEMLPIIDAYVADGFDFIALRLSPDSAVSQMKPVRVITPGSSFALPLQMVAAGTGDSTALTLFMLGEGRYEAQNFTNTIVPRAEVAWNYNVSRSNYAELRSDLLQQNDGRTWLTSYAQPGALFSQIDDEITETGLTYGVNGANARTIAEAYVLQGIANGEGETTDCLTHFNDAANAMGTVVEDMCETGPDCPRPTEDQIPASSLACGNLDDVATAMVGMHPADVWVTRLEAELPRTALDADLMLEASMNQTAVGHRFYAPKSENHPCPGQAGAIIFSTPKAPRIPGGPVTLVLGAAALGFMMRRRRRTALAAT